MASSAPTPIPTQTPTPVSDDSAATCTTAVPDQYGHVPFDACNSNYNYDPQYIPAVAVAVVFGVLTVAHIAEAAIFKKRYAWVVCMGALWETVAFILGAVGAHDQQNAQYSVYHMLLFLLAPLWINAFVYMTLSRMMHFYLPDQKVWKIKSTSMSKIFVWADVLTFLIQAGGGSMSSPGADVETIKIGLDIYTGGVGLQEACIIAFIVLMVIFHRKAAALDNGAVFQDTTDGRDQYFVPKKGWKAQIYTLYIVLLLITVRIAYRIAEFGGGLDPATNPLPFHEIYAYAFDAAPMMAALVLLMICHPGRILQGPNSDFTEYRKQKKAAKQAKKAEKKEKKAAKKMGKDIVLEDQLSTSSPYRYESA